MAIVDKVLIIESELTTSDVTIECALDISSGGRLPFYNGEYEITPKAYDEILLSTKNKSMRNDVKVKAIPTEEISNVGGGYTFVIARED